MAIDAVLKLFKTFKLFLMKSLGFKILFEKNVFRPWTNFSVSLIISYLSTSFRKINTTSKNIVLLYAIHYDLLIKIDTNITGVFFKLRWFFSFNCKTNGNCLKKVRRLSVRKWHFTENFQNKVYPTWDVLASQVTSKL